MHNCVIKIGRMVGESERAPTRLERVLCRYQASQASAFAALCFTSRLTVALSCRSSAKLGQPKESRLICR
jgi:hypothetical protein